MAGTPLLGSIFLFAGNFAPRGYMLCNGAILSIAQNTALFSILGTTYGGNGTSTFALPDLRGRVPLGMGQGPGLSNYVLGQSGGVENVTLLTTNLPAHSHTVNAVSTAGNTASPAGALPATGGGIHPASPLPTPANFSNAAGNTAMSAGMITGGGSNVPHTNVQPYLAVIYIIAVQGIFPSRN